MLGVAQSGTNPLKTYRWDSNAWVGLATTGPISRVFQAMVGEPTGGVVLFGSIDGTGFLADTWQFNGTAWTQLFPATSPPARMLAGMAADVQVTLPFGIPRTEVILSSGLGANGPLTDVWIFQAGNWISQTGLTGTIVNGLTTGAFDTLHREAVFAGTAAAAAFVVGKFGFTTYALGCACPNNATPILTCGSIAP